jgi:hypothetical protein
MVWVQFVLFAAEFQPFLLPLFSRERSLQVTTTYDAILCKAQPLRRLKVKLKEQTKLFAKMPDEQLW